MRVTKTVWTLGAAALLALAPGAPTAAWGQYQPPGPQINGCPLRAVDAVIESISPKGEMVLNERGETIVGRITTETRYRISGYSQKQIQEAPSIQFPPGTRAKFLICEANGDVIDMKVVEDLRRDKKSKKKKAKDDDKEQEKPDR
ncbi:MAG: hypothetical protein GC160_01010 [Acidobacteria bacterium]|nr:hypothetical protein [Acidobacteriota bacterium]